jgi:hypothetical protein
LEQVDVQELPSIKQLSVPHLFSPNSFGVRFEHSFLTHFFLYESKEKCAALEHVGFSVVFSLHFPATPSDSSQ